MSRLGSFLSFDGLHERPQVRHPEWAGAVLGSWMGASFLALLAMTTAGCGDATPTSEDVPDVVAEEAGPAAESVSESEEVQDSVRFAVWPQIQEQVFGEPGKEGKTDEIVVVDFWSLSCPPCLKELPELARLNEQHREGLRCVGVALDFNGRQSRPPKSYEPKIRLVLKGIDATFVNYICETPDSEVLDALQIPSIPAVFVYDGEGKLLKRFVDAGETAGFNYRKDVIPYLDSLNR
ncbi:MAG: TlpA disulfide reductase family protein [Planctomycetota bacterium]